MTMELAENARVFYDAGNGWAVKMSLPEGRDSAIVTDGVFRFWDTEWPVPGGTEFAVEVWDAGSNGMPGTETSRSNCRNSKTRRHMDISEPKRS